MGTATYFSPEQAEGIGVDARSDIYSLGVVLFEMVTGRPPFMGDTPVSVASKHVRDHPPAPRELNPSIPPTFEAIILKSMAKDPAHRYQTAEELRADLLRFNEGRSVLAMDEAVAATSMVAAVGATQTLGAVDGSDLTQSVASTTPVEEDVDDEGPNRTRTYAIILAILLVLLVVAGYFLARNLGYFGGSPSFNLANVTGQPVAQATTTLRNDGLVVKRNNQVSNDAAGTVISTDPAPKSLVKKGDTVTLNVAVPAPISKVAVPSGLVGVPVAHAESVLQGEGLQYTVAYKASNTVNSGIVLSTDPSAGTRVAQGSSVTLTVSSGQANITVPSLIGQSQTQAASLLTQAGLTLGNITPQASQYPAGEIVSSTPGAGASVRPGSSVSIAVSSGPPPVTTTTSSTTTTTLPSTTTTSSTPSSSTTTTTGAGGNARKKKH
jgi:serine/threonine-protein kinase